MSCLAQQGADWRGSATCPPSTKVDFAADLRTFKAMTMSATMPLVASSTAFDCSISATRLWD